MIARVDYHKCACAQQWTSESIDERHLLRLLQSFVASFFALATSSCWRVLLWQEEREFVFVW